MSFPMMSDEELAALGEDIKANGLSVPVDPVVNDATPRVLIDGRNRLEAMERVGHRSDGRRPMHERTLTH